MTDELDSRDQPSTRAKPVSPESIDDLTLAALVRDVADDWRMPPQRLDSPAWSDRVGIGSRRPWLARLARAGTLAIVATLGLSLIAVWLSLPTRVPSEVGTTPATSGAAATPRATDRRSPSPLPKLTLTGQPPTAREILVRVGPDYALADLTTGGLGQRITASSGSSSLRQLPDGRLVCLCLDTDGYVAGAFSHALVSLRTYDRTGAPIDRTVIGEYTGAPDPRPGIPEDLPPHVDVNMSFSADGRLGFVGWSVRKPTDAVTGVWQAGLVVVDLAAGRVIQRLTLPEISTGPADAIVEAFGPYVTVSSDGSRALVSRDRYAIDAATKVFHNKSDQFMATVAAGRLGTPTSFASAGGCPEGQAATGFTPDDRVWLACWSGNARLSVRRLGLDGSLRGETPVEQSGEDGATWLATPDGQAVYFWAPGTRVLSRLDLATGQVTSGTAPAPTGTVVSGPLAGLGRWLAPPATAKVFLRPGLALSPDGSRLYALGVASEAGGMAGSTGVFSFDATSLAPLGNWPPTADFISLAISRDGRFVYAAGAPGVDASGQQSAFSASITVYDTGDGSVRLVAGQLDHDDVSFLGPILP